MLDMLTALLTGGLTGLLGTALTAGVDYFKARQRHAQELDLRRLDLDIAQVEAASAERRVAIQAETERDKAEWEGFKASYREARQRWSTGESGWIVFVDVVRGLTRPAGAWSFLAITGAIYFTLGADDAVLRARIVETVLYLTTTAWLWWFGARQLAKRPEAVR